MIIPGALEPLRHRLREIDFDPVAPAERLGDLSRVHPAEAGRVGVFGDLLHLEHLDEDVGQRPPIGALDEDVQCGIAHVELRYAVGEGEVQDVVAFVPQSWIWNKAIDLVCLLIYVSRFRVLFRIMK